MFEPTGTESKKTIEEVAKKLIAIYRQAEEHLETLHDLPLTTPIRRVDEVGAARKPVLRYFNRTER